MLDVRLFRNPSFSGASGAITFVFFALMGSMFFLTQYLQDVLGYSALGAGLRVSPIAIGLIIGGPVSAKLAARFGTKAVVTGGLVLVAAGLSIATQFEVGTGYGVVLAHLLVMGFGMGMAMAPATDSVMGSVPLDKASVGSAVNDTTRTTGGALGVAVLGSLLASQYRGDMDDAVAGLPHRAADLAGDSLGGGLAVAHKLGSPELVDAAHTAFVSGMHVAALAAAGVALLGAARRRRGHPRPRARARPATAPAGAGPRMSKTAESPRRAPGRPRSEASHQAIIRATLELLLEVGYRALTMEACAARRRRQGHDLPPLGLQGGAGARRDRLMHDDFDAPDTGSLRGDYAGDRRRGARRAQRAGAATFAPRCSARRSTIPSCTRSSTRTSCSRGATRCGGPASARSSAARSATTSTSS
jgi:MFS family permease